MLFQMEKRLSPETLEKFKIYEGLLREWNRRTTLVQEDTLPEFYSRHILDSLQIIPLIDALNSPFPPPPFKNSLPALLEEQPKAETLERRRKISIIDIGAGAGFPGMVLAMCEFANVVLCESNQKKCFFLEEAARQTNTAVAILNERAEKALSPYEVIVSRACMNLKDLCFLLRRLCSQSSGVGIFHKGRNWRQELHAAQLIWSFDWESYKSATSDEGAILLLKNLRKI